MADSESVRLTEKQCEQIARALAEPRRLQILKQIGACTGTLPCAALIETHEVSPATLSHHIKELETAGLIHVARQGKFHFLAVRPGVLEALAASLSSLRPRDCNSTGNAPE
jgi:ArsR family transcriptional regulator, arsenate/arsenite/antimonite-responsive transcriptional repressor